MVIGGSEHNFSDHHFCKNGNSSFQSFKFRIVLLISHSLLMEELILYGIAYECPHKERKMDCPLQKIEHLSYKEKIDWINGISNEKKVAIVNRHMQCTTEVREF